LEELFSKSRSNKYPDSKKSNYFIELRSIFDSIISSDYDSFSHRERIEHRQIFDYLFNGLEFLDTSTLNIIPFELVSCLEKALNDWVNSDNLMIMTSLSNRRADIWFQGWPVESIKQIKTLIFSKYSKTISSRLIRISLPKSLSRDYLSSIVLYHELGHFIDLELNITEKIFYDKYKKTSREINSNEEYLFLNHYKEYFADLFAAQYINDSSANYLNHLAYNSGDSPTHPATHKRDKIVRCFLSGETTEEIDQIQRALHKISGKYLTVKHKIIDYENSNFTQLIPEDISSEAELHAIFKLGWDLWLNSNSNFLNEFSRRQKYYVINNLIEKSISNYNVLLNWKEIKIREEQ
jgi:hypothetical protein